jgi:hypothetical protein
VSFKILETRDVHTLLPDFLYIAHDPDWFGVGVIARVVGVAVHEPHNHATAFGGLTGIAHRSAGRDSLHGLWLK